MVSAYNLGDISLLSVLLPRSCANLAFDVELSTFSDVLLSEFGSMSPADDVMPLGFPFPSCCCLSLVDENVATLFSPTITWHLFRRIALFNSYLKKLMFVSSFLVRTVASACGPQITLDAITLKTVPHSHLTFQMEFLVRFLSSEWCF